MIHVMVSFERSHAYLRSKDAESITIYIIIYGMMGPHAVSMQYIYMHAWAHMLGALSIFVGPLLGALGCTKSAGMGPLQKAFICQVYKHAMCMVYGLKYVPLDNCDLPLHLINLGVSFM
jgi:hypothetical protein